MYKAKQAAFEQTLRRFCGGALYKFPPKLRESMEYSLIGTGGKRLRPLMFLECYNMFKGAVCQSIRDAACAIECIHISSLVHDDLPCMDDDAERRGIPSAHVKFGEAVALLSGDALLNLAYETLFDAVCDSNFDKQVAQGCRVIAKAAGGGGMLGGQIVDILLQKSDASPESMGREAEYIYNNKTGALFAAAVKAGAVMAGVGGGDLESITEFGRDFGFAFQLLDDYNEIKEAGSGKIDPSVSPYFAYKGLDAGVLELTNLTAGISARLADIGKRFDISFFSELTAMFKLKQH